MKTKNLVLTAMFTALTMVLGSLVIVLSFTSILISPATIPTYLYGALLPKRNAFSALVVYLMLGAIGLPVFSRLRGGLGILAGPIGGSLLAYLIMAFVIALLLEKLLQNRFYSVVIVFSVALVICYIVDCLMSVAVAHVDLAKALSLTVIPFVPLDLARIVFATAATLALKKALYHAKLLPSIWIEPIITYTTQKNRSGARSDFLIHSDSSKITL